MRTNSVLAMYINNHDELDWTDGKKLLKAGDLCLITNTHDDCFEVNGILHYTFRAHEFAVLSVLMK